MYLASSLILLFANTAEDVQLNIAVLLLAFLLYLRRSTPWLGVALFLVVLGRPQLVIVWAAVVLTELLVGERVEGKNRFRTVITDRFVLVNLGVATGLFAAWDILLVVRHQNWLLHNGHVIDTTLTSLKPLNVEGFTISKFSGAYALHALWMYPAALLLSALVALWFRRDLSADGRRALVFGLIVVASCILISEAEPLFYYNLRYLAYPFPFLMIAAFMIFDVRRTPTNRRVIFGRPALVAVVALSVLTTPFYAVAEHRHLMKLNIARAEPHREKIARIVGNADVGTTSTASRNYIAYLLRRPVNRIGVGPRPGNDFHGYIFTSGKGAALGEVVWQSGPLLLVKVP